MKIEMVLQAATLISIIVRFFGLLSTLRIYRRQLDANLFLSLTQRYEAIMDGFPEEALGARLDKSSSPPSSQKLSLAVLKYLNLCSEEFYLWKRHYLPNSLWSIWEREIKRTLSSALIRREWPTLKQEFKSYPEFKTYVEDIQKKEEHEQEREDDNKENEGAKSETV